MQAMGMVNDHASGCHVRERAQAQRRAIRSGMGLSGAEAS